MVAKVSIPLYHTWRQMHARCYNPHNTRYHCYGARGIKVCKRWHNFWTFLKDMGHRPEDRTLDRIDNDGDYKPSNCRWATMAEQKRNTRQTRLITFHGETKCLKDWARIVGVNQGTLAKRLDTWPLSEALTTPKGAR